MAIGGRGRGCNFSIKHARTHTHTELVSLGVHDDQRSYSRYSIPIGWRLSPRINRIRQGMSMRPVEMTEPGKEHATKPSVLRPVQEFNQGANKLSQGIHETLMLVSGKVRGALGLDKRPLNDCINNVLGETEKLVNDIKGAQPPPSEEPAQETQDNAEE